MRRFVPKHPAYAADQRARRDAMNAPWRPSDRCGDNDRAKAEEYARWLAARDGVDLEGLHATDVVTYPLPGAEHPPKRHDMRPAAVVFTAGHGPSFRATRVCLPGWDHVPSCIDLSETSPIGDEEWDPCA